MYGHVVFNMEPLERGNGVRFENKIFGGSVPTEYIPAVERGVQEAAESGVLAGYPVTDILVQLIDGSFHEVDSNEMAFRMAAILGFKEGMQKGAPVLLEPIMRVEVVMPEEYLGDVLGQLNARRGIIQGMEMRPGNAQAARALVPLGEMFGYATSLRSATQGRGVFSMEFDHYAPLSDSVAQKVLNQ
jgi:elongation factor G